METVNGFPAKAFGFDSAGRNPYECHTRPARRPAKLSMTTTDPSLADLRREIDEIDDALHDLLMRRGQLQERIRQAKAGSRVYIRPGREAMVLRRLIGRHKGAFPKAAVVHIWREIFAAAVSIQGHFSVGVLRSSTQGETLGRLARDHFGALTPVRELGTASRVLQAVADGTVAVGVLPMPETEEAAPWWPSLARRGDGVPRIMARLPFAQPPGGSRRGEALAVGLNIPQETGDDRGYLAVEAAENTSRSALRRVLQKAGFEVTDWKSYIGPDGTAYYLIEHSGILTDDDQRLAQLVETGEDVIAMAWPLGGYAMPLSAAELG